MMRPFYEQKEHRDSENAIAEEIANLKGLGHVKFPLGATVDRALVDGEGTVKALLEIKTRTTPIAKYPTYCCSEERMATYRLIAQRLKVPALLAVRWTDATGIIDVRRAPFLRLVEQGGRFDRNDPKDIEPMIHWAINAFWIVPSAADSGKRQEGKRREKQ
jgi:hypothetical protein